MGFCPPNAPYYNTTIHLCTMCPDGTTFSNSTYQCDKKNSGTNGTNNNGSGSISDNTPTICPPNTPFYNETSRSCS